MNLTEARIALRQVLFILHSKSVIGALVPSAIDQENFYVLNCPTKPKSVTTQMKALDECLEQLQNNHFYLKYVRGIL